MFRMSAFSIRVVVAAVTVVLAALTPARANLSDKLGQILQEAQRAEALRLYERAVELYRKALQDGLGSDGERREMLKLRAVAYERSNELAKAEADLTAVLQMTPVQAMAYADRGYFFLRHGRYPDALSDFVAGTRIDPGNPLFPFAAGRVLVALKNDIGAVALYNDAIRLNPKIATPYLARAESYIRMKMYREAIADYDRAMKLKLTGANDWFFLHIGRGYAHLAMESYDRAEPDFDEALAMAPNDFQTLVWRGYARERLGRRDLAIEDYERAYRITPRSDWVRASLNRLRSYAAQP